MKKVASKIVVGLMLLVIIMVMLVLVFGCTDTRYLTRRCDRMEVGQPSDTAYSYDKNGIYIINN